MYCCACRLLQAILSQVHASSDSGIPTQIQLANTSGGIFSKLFFFLRRSRFSLTAPLFQSICLECIVASSATSSLLTCVVLCERINGK